MKIEKYKVEDVDPKGIVKGGGAVEVKGKVMISTGEGCLVKGCHCSDGYWISIVLPRTEEGVVESVRAVFEDKKEMDSFFLLQELIASGVK